MLRLSRLRRRLFFRLNLLHRTQKGGVMMANNTPHDRYGTPLGHFSADTSGRDMRRDLTKVRRSATNTVESAIQSTYYKAQSVAIGGDELDREIQSGIKNLKDAGNIAAGLGLGVGGYALLNSVQDAYRGRQESEKKALLKQLENNNPEIKDIYKDRKRDSRSDDTIREFYLNSTNMSYANAEIGITAHKGKLDNSTASVNNSNFSEEKKAKYRELAQKRYDSAVAPHLQTMQDVEADFNRSISGGSSHLRNGTVTKQSTDIIIKDLYLNQTDSQYCRLSDRYNAALANFRFEQTRIKSLGLLTAQEQKMLFDAEAKFKRETSSIRAKMLEKQNKIDLNKKETLDKILKHPAFKNSPEMQYLIATHIKQNRSKKDFAKESAITRRGRRKVAQSRRKGKRTVRRRLKKMLRDSQKGNELNSSLNKAIGVQKKVKSYLGTFKTVGKMNAALAHGLVITALHSNTNFFHRFFSKRFSHLGISAKMGLNKIGKRFVSAHPKITKVLKVEKKGGKIVGKAGGRVGRLLGKGANAISHPGQAVGGIARFGVRKTARGAYFLTKKTTKSVLKSTDFLLSHFKIYRKLKVGTLKIGHGLKVLSNPIGWLISAPFRFLKWILGAIIGAITGIISAIVGAIIAIAATFLTMSAVIILLMAMLASVLSVIQGLVDGLIIDPNAKENFVYYSPLDLENLAAEYRNAEFELFDRIDQKEIKVNSDPLNARNFRFFGLFSEDETMKAENEKAKFEFERSGCDFSTEDLVFKLDCYDNVELSFVDNDGVVTGYEISNAMDALAMADALYQQKQEKMQWNEAAAYLGVPSDDVEFKPSETSGATDLFTLSHLPRYVKGTNANDATFHSNTEAADGQCDNTKMITVQKKTSSEVTYYHTVNNCPADEHFVKLDSTENVVPEKVGATEAFYRCNFENFLSNGTYRTTINGVTYTQSKSSNEYSTLTDFPGASFNLPIGTTVFLIQDSNAKGSYLVFQKTNEGNNYIGRYSPTNSLIKRYAPSCFWGNWDGMSLTYQRYISNSGATVNVTHKITATEQFVCPGHSQELENTETYNVAVCAGHIDLKATIQVLTGDALYDAAKQLPKQEHLSAEENKNNNTVQTWISKHVLPFYHPIMYDLEAYNPSEDWSDESLRSAAEAKRTLQVEHQFPEDNRDKWFDRTETAVDGTLLYHLKYNGQEIYTSKLISGDQKELPIYKIQYDPDTGKTGYVFSGTGFTIFRDGRMLISEMKLKE